MKLIKVIKRFFLFVSALLLTLIVSVNYTNAEIAPLDQELINLEISVNSENSSSPSFKFEILSDSQGKLPSVMYLIYIPATLLINLLLKKLDGTVRNSRQLPLLDDYEIAYLAGGKERTIDLAIVNLIDSGSVTFNSTTGNFSTYNIQCANLHPIEENLIYKINGRKRVDIYNDKCIVKNTLEKVRKYLEKNQLLLTQRQSNYVLFASAIPTILVTILMLFQNTLFGIVFILLNLILLPKIGNLLFPSEPYRSQYGDYVLKHLRKQNPPTKVSSNISFGFALFGLRIIPFGHAETALSWTPPYWNIEVRETSDKVPADLNRDRGYR
ncbi:MAG: TIGR04222 domain-containing membrane protein [Cyanobacteria bacterium J06643_5]